MGILILDFLKWELYLSCLYAQFVINMRVQFSFLVFSRVSILEQIGEQNHSPFPGNPAPEILAGKDPNHPRVDYVRIPMPPPDSSCSS